MLSVPVCGIQTPRVRGGVGTSGSPRPTSGLDGPCPAVRMGPMQMSPARRPHRTVRGFTLIELLVAIAILAIIAAVAFPSFQDSIRKGRRADAFSAIAAVQQSQERWRANNQQFSTSLSALRVASPALYTVTISAPPDPATLSTGYVVVAEGIGSQSGDRQCKKLGAQLLNGTLSVAGCTGCTELTYAATSPCWNR